MNIIEINPLKNPTIATIQIPGSKSYTNRALIIAALTAHSVTIKNPLFSDDTQAMISCLQTLGIKTKISENQIEIIGSIDDIKEKEYDLDANLSGTTIRFILALSTIIPGVKIIHGKEGLNNRPIKDLVDSLRQLGAHIEYSEKDGYPPLKVTSSKLSPGLVMINGTVSSQYLSSLLLIAPIAGDITIIVEDDQISKPYIDMTIDTMKHFGVIVTNKDYLEYTIPKQNYTAAEYLVEGDLSSAGYFFAIAALTKSTITLQNLNYDSKQADKKLLAVLEKMGNQIQYRNNEIVIKGKDIQAIDIDVTDFPDQAQTLAVLAAFANGLTKLTGIQSLRVKETERVVALQNELGKMGIETQATANTLTIHGGNPKSALITTYDDHRMAMAFAVAGTTLAGITIKDPDVVNKTFPSFWKKLSDMGVQLRSENKTNIVLIGMRGSGKTTIGKMLAKKLQKDFIDLDAALVRKADKSLAQIIQENGWEYFRNEEAKIVETIKDKKNMVIATGGGVILKEENIKILKTDGFFIFLNATPETLADRIGDDAQRPPLTQNASLKDELIEVLKKREHIYKYIADSIIDTDTLTEKEVVQKIERIL